MSNPDPDTGDPAQAGSSAQIAPSTSARPPNPSVGATKRFERPSYEIHYPNSPPVVVPVKKAYGIDVDQGPYSGWRIYNDFKQITKDPSTWPEQHTLLQDWHIPHVVENLTCAERKERHPADFDGTGQLRSQRQPRGRAAKHDSKEADDTVALRYMVYKKYYQLHGDEGAKHMTYHVKNAPEQTRGPEVRGKKGWSLGDVALVPTDFLPTNYELRIGTHPSRYNVNANNSARSAKGIFTSKSSRPRPSRSRTPATARTGVQPEAEREVETEAETEAETKVQAEGETETQTDAEASNKEKSASPEKSSAEHEISQEVTQIVPGVNFPTVNFRGLDLVAMAKGASAGTLVKKKHPQSASTKSKAKFDESVAQINMEPDPLDMSVNKETYQVPVANMKPQTVFTKFEASLRDVVKELADVDEARMDALKACDQLYKIFIKEVLFLVKNNNEEEDWIIGGLNGICDILTVTGNAAIQAQQIMTAHYMASVLIHILKERHWEERKRLSDRVHKLGLYPENAKFWQQAIDMLEPREKAEPTEFTQMPGPLMQPIHKEDFKSSLEAIHAKRYLNHGHREPRSVSKALYDYKALAALDQNGSAKRAQTLSGEEETPSKRRCTEEMMEGLHPSVETEDNEAIANAGEDEGNVDESEESVEGEDAAATADTS